MRPPQLLTRLQRVWSQAILTLLLMITAAWMVFLGYGVVELVETVL